MHNNDKKRKIAVFGSTGSVGVQTLRVIERNSDQMEVIALVAKSNVDLIEKQIHTFRPEIVCMFDEEAKNELKRRVKDVEIVSGAEGLSIVATWPGVDFAMMAMVGTDALGPALEAIEANIDLGIANKELLVAAGELITKRAKEKNVTLFPVDSEHSAIFQCLQGESIEDVRRIILTASGGPFLNYHFDDLRGITPQEAAKHPNWDMGLKVSIDCSTLMNKGLEVIEAKWLFDIDVANIDVVIHPQSLVHSFVEFYDGALKAQIGPHEMEVPIQYALTYPRHISRDVALFDFTKYSRMDFYTPDTDRFRCLKLAYEALQEGGFYPCYLNAANEVLVERFCRGDVSWLSIGEKLDSLLQTYQMQPVEMDIEAVLEVDAAARRAAKII